MKMDSVRHLHTIHLLALEILRPLVADSSKGPTKHARVRSAKFGKAELGGKLLNNTRIREI